MIEYGTRDSNSTPLQARPFVALFFILLLFIIIFIYLFWGVRWRWVGNFLKLKNGYNGKLSLYKVATTRKIVIKNVVTCVCCQRVVFGYI